MPKRTARNKKVKALKLQLGDEHPNHDKHLCHIVGLRNMKAAGRLAKDAQYLCAICGRAAKKQANLCMPVAI